MHGLIFFAIQSFLTDMAGLAVWSRVAARLGMDNSGFEPMLPHDPDNLPRLLEAAEAETGKPRCELLEDVGTYLVSHPSCAHIRRLLRYGGADFSEFLSSLNELPDRVLLALPDMDMPMLSLVDMSPTRFRLVCSSPIPVFGPVFLGLLRAMADDYGALVLIEHAGRHEGEDVIELTLFDGEFNSARAFRLGNAGEPSGASAA